MSRVFFPFADDLRILAQRN